MSSGFLKRKCYKIVLGAICLLVVVSTIIIHIHSALNTPNGFLESVKDTYRYYRRRGKRVNPLDFSYTIPGEKICRDGVPFLLVLVVSLHSRRAERDAIRATWGSVSSGKLWPRGPSGFVPPDSPPNLLTKVIFLFGTHPNDTHNRELLHESAEYNDVVQADFTESYRNLTLKVLMGLKWARSHCREAEFIMKVDDDTFVNVPMIVDYILSKDYWDKTIMGFINTNSMPFRFYTKWQVSWKEYPYFKYPTYVSGNIYLFLSITSRLLLDVAEYVPYVSMEDAYVTGILAEVIRAKHHLIPFKWYNPYQTATVCELATNAKIASQMMTAELHYQVWRAILDKTCK